jgi:glycosyltransferase involved in cell wall biosynthesis
MMSSDRGSPPIHAIVTCYNVGRFLDETLASVFSQTTTAHTVTVVDDGSTDDTQAVLARHGSRLSVVSRNNGGISAARNSGIASVTDGLVAFLDGDDLWTPESLDCRLAAFLADPRLDLVYGAVRQFRSVDTAEGRVRAPHGEPLQARLAGSMLIRRDFFDRIGLFNEAFRIGETIDWVARAAESGARIACVEPVVLERRIHGDNTVIREKQRTGDYLRALKASIDRRAASGHAIRDKQ